MKKNVEKYIVSGDPKVDAVYHNLEWIITALAGTLVFIVFVMQVYRIPTGSMAETLRGSHFRLRCSECGYRYDYEFYPREYKMAENSVPRQNLPVVPVSPRCPSCGWYEDSGQPSKVDGRFYTTDGKPAPQRAVSRGDQIFVLKCIYQFLEPKRWDVIVFKNPIQPEINYIKRLVALPGERVEIIDGDMYINDRIARKPAKVQEELWMPIYNNDYQPARTDGTRFNGRRWEQPFEPADQGWSLNADGPMVFSLTGGDRNAMRTLRYNPVKGNDFKAVYGYDPSQMIPAMAVCSDLMLAYCVDLGADSGIGAVLSKYGIRYRGLVDSDGHMTISRIGVDGAEEQLASGQTLSEETDRMALLRFANVDHKLILEYGVNKLEYDLGMGRHDAGMDRNSSPVAEIVGYGNARLHHVKLMRDIYYTGAEDKRVMRAYEGQPLDLQADEFFVCGDNSPNSYDARMWKEPTKANPGQTYRDGIVPRDYLVGKAFFVHFPGNWRFEKQGWRIIPYLDGSPEPDGMKIIYGSERFSTAEPKP